MSVNRHHLVYGLVHDAFPDPLFTTRMVRFVLPRSSDTDGSCDLLSADVQHEEDQKYRNGSNITRSSKPRLR